MYYPILRHSDSEMNAFQETSEETKKKIIPIIEGKRISVKKSAKKAWYENFNSAGNYLKQRIGSNEFIYCFDYIFANMKSKTEEKKDGKNQIEFLCSKFEESSLNFIPCLSSDAPDWIINTISSIDKNKVAIRIEYHKVESTIYHLMNTRVEEIINDYFKDKEVIIILDFLDELNQDEAIKCVKYFSNYTCILATSSVDETVDTKRQMKFEKKSNRNEIQFFKKIQAEEPSILFSDYTTRLTPEPDVKEGFNMNNSYLKILYTTKEGYFLGLSKRFDDNEPENFQDLCKIIVSSPLYSGKNYSFGDEFIDSLSNRNEEVTDHKKAIELSINHHLEFTVDEL
ncbi:beta family protein [Alkalibacillus almallahensis]|uniref:beta family protein n=1 Tax=Alkalibacillus almallahensis TaxID=1379154 RepID=UPI001420C6EE|nr:hypothetical protein [Alkalibacillus almallahensis]NIK11152.1 hypothetical protein [Alkalibacillus almallahensis]